MIRKIALVLAAMLTVGACSSQAARQPNIGATYQVGDTVSVSGVFLADQGLNPTTDTQPWVKITVTEAKVVASYGVLSDDAPKSAGDIFIQVNVAYEALHDGVGYDPLDWMLYVNDNAIDASDAQADVPDGPTPMLSFGALPQKGSKAVGYIVFEAPPEGEIRMGYGRVTGVCSQSVLSSMPSEFWPVLECDSALFEVVIRAS